MSYTVSIPYIEDVFENAWEVACEVCLEKDKMAGGSEITNYFLKQGMILTPVKNYHYVGKRQWGWSHIIFKSKSEYVLFMLEWS
jgi:hypothetical protein